ncbi:MAG: hypothetical protein DIZ80_03980 [endosymbiont of Galathealinum brachiosum]|uniref:Uncharacterized protein n=1 Tax=endosymbiont of Galathealinum brachiosum TaxID=2200906 RepID=A0A370DK06_9GAMM|nr:MAG: hypothetical protein DIZ80_03980 [endosymbiont of Galathealinum brachiosum]
MKEVKGVTIYFNDGTKLVIEYPKQDVNEYDMVTKLNEMLDSRHFLVESNGAMLFIPVDNIKYLQVYPAPEKLPPNTITGATILEV